MRRVVGIFATLFVVVLAALSFVAVRTYVDNQSQFEAWTQQLLEHPLPAGMTLIDSGSRFGMLWGLGDHCDGEAWLTLQGEVGEEELEEHYLEVTNARVKADEGGVWRVSALRTHLGPPGLDYRCF